MNPATANPMDELIRLVTDTRYEDLPAQAIDRAKAFLLDTVGVGIAGNRAPLSADVLQAALGWGASADASVLGSELRLPAPSAALVNGYRIHSQEFDCVFEPGVIIPLGPLVAAILAHVERRIARGESVTGRARCGARPGPGGQKRHEVLPTRHHRRILGAGCAVRNRRGRQ